LREKILRRDKDNKIENELENLLKNKLDENKLYKEKKRN